MISFPRKLHDTEPRQEKCTFSDSLTQEGTSLTSLQPGWIYTLPDVRDFFAPFSGPVVAWRTDPRKRAEKTFSSLSTRGLFQRAMLFWSDLEGVFSDQKKRKKICSNQDNKQSKPIQIRLLSMDRLLLISISPEFRFTDIWNPFYFSLWKFLY